MLDTIMTGRFATMEWVSRFRVGGPLGRTGKSQVRFERLAEAFNCFFESVGDGERRSLRWNIRRKR